jgi:hypothetical protein
MIEQIPDPVKRRVVIDRNIRAAGFQDPQHHRHHLKRAFQDHGHEILALHTVVAQEAREAIRCLFQFTIRISRSP